MPRRGIRSLFFIPTRAGSWALIGPSDRRDRQPRLERRSKVVETPPVLERGTKLDRLQLWGTAVATALATRNTDLVRTIVHEARAHLSAQELEAARTAAAIMAMNNVYYRFVHLVSDTEYDKLPARLRMQGIATHGVDPVAFELWSLAVSAVNGCGKCIDSHERVLREKGASREHVQDAVRLAAVLAATAAALDGEVALAGPRHELMGPW